MRGTAFIVSRKGANENPLKAARGALRESGKLIICLSLDDIFDLTCWSSLTLSIFSAIFTLTKQRYLRPPS